MVANTINVNSSKYSTKIKHLFHSPNHLFPPEKILLKKITIHFLPVFKNLTFHSVINLLYLPSIKKKLSTITNVLLGFCPIYSKNSWKTSLCNSGNLKIVSGELIFILFNSIACFAFISLNMGILFINEINSVSKSL